MNWEMLRSAEMLILPKWVCGFHIIPFKLPESVFVELDERILKFFWKCKEPGRVKAILKKKNQFGECTLSAF